MTFPKRIVSVYDNVRCFTRRTKPNRTSITCYLIIYTDNLHNIYLSLRYSTANRQIFASLHDLKRKLGALFIDSLFAVFEMYSVQVFYTLYKVLYFVQAFFVVN